VEKIIQSINKHTNIQINFGNQSEECDGVLKSEISSLIEQ